MNYIVAKDIYITKILKKLILSILIIIKYSF